MPKAYVYVVARDFGFAPNPFHGACTLATCKPKIRGKACLGDWVIGVGGAKLKAVGRCVFAMQVTQASSFDAYWSDHAFLDKRPVRNGSRRMQVGDNIYHRIDAGSGWRQADSHHSQPDGGEDRHNMARDTSVDRVLISRRFLYFGSSAPLVPDGILASIGYRNAIGHRVFELGRCQALVDWLLSTHGRRINEVSGMPFQFRQSHARYSVRTDRLSV